MGLPLRLRCERGACVVCMNCDVDTLSQGRKTGQRSGARKKTEALSRCENLCELSWFAMHGSREDGISIRRLSPTGEAPPTRGHLRNERQSCCDLWGLTLSASAGYLRKKCIVLGSWVWFDESVHPISYGKRAWLYSLCLRWSCYRVSESLQCGFISLTLAAPVWPLRGCYRKGINILDEWLGHWYPALWDDFAMGRAWRVKESSLKFFPAMIVPKSCGNR